MVLDHDLAFVGGMNLKSADFDSSRHEIFDDNRMAYGAFDITRALVVTKHRHPDNGPRKDYMVRIQGPAAQDVAEVFQERWQHLRDRKVKFSDMTTAFDVKHDIAPREGGAEERNRTLVR